MKRGVLRNRFSKKPPGFVCACCNPTRLEILNQKTNISVLSGLDLPGNTSIRDQIFEIADFMYRNLPFFSSPGHTGKARSGMLPSKNAVADLQGPDRVPGYSGLIGKTPFFSF
jgi:hypothetical protein